MWKLALVIKKLTKKVHKLLQPKLILHITYRQKLKLNLEQPIRKLNKELRASIQ